MHRRVWTGAPQGWICRSRKLEEQHEMSRRIVFQGEPGANSHIACRETYPDQ